MVLKTLTFRRSTPLHGESSIEHRNTSTPNNSTNRGNRTSQSTSNGYQGNNSNGSYYGSPRGRGGNQGNRYNNQEGGISAARHLQQQLSQINEHAHIKPRYGGLPVYSASVASTLQQSSDKQEISEPATIIWCDGGIGEVMSPCVWRHPNLHLYFHPTETKMEGKDGWKGLKTELEPGMEMDVSFSLPQSLLYELQLTAVQEAEDKHTFICIDKILELRASRCSSVRTHEQAVVIAKRKIGVAFLINNAGERTVLHPNFLPLDAVRHAIFEKTRGQKQITIAEIDSPSSLFVLGRSLAVRLAPAPAWLPTIYPTDRGVTRWGLSAEPYGEEKQGRAVVVKWTRHSIILCPVEGDLKGKKTSLHSPCIQMPIPMKTAAQEIGSCWRFRACRELPGRSAVWRAFEIVQDLGLDDPIPEGEIESILMKNRLISTELEEEYLIDPPLLSGDNNVERREKEEERRSVLDDLVQLFSHPLNETEPAGGNYVHDFAVPMQISVDDEDDDVLVFDSIDDMLDSSTFVTDVFKAPSILPNEWMLLGVPPEEAIKTEQEMLLADLPRVIPMERTFGIFRIGDERPDMRVQPKKTMKRKSRRIVESIISSEEEEDIQMRLGAAPLRTQANSQLNNENIESTVRQTDEKNGKELKREMKEDSRHKKHLASIDVKFATGSDDFFNLLHGDEKSDVVASPIPFAMTRDERPPRAVEATLSSLVARVDPPSSVRLVTCGLDMFDLFDGSTQTVVPTAKSGQSLPSASPSPPSSTVPPAPEFPHPYDLAVVEGRPRVPRFNILPYPEQPRLADGWWFRRTRPPLPVESMKERRKKRRDEEDRRMRKEESHSDSDVAPFREDERPERRPVDNFRQSMMDALKKKDEMKQVKPLSLVTTFEKEDKENYVEVLVDLSPVINWSSPSAATSDSAHFVHTPKEVHDDLKDLF